MTLTEGKTMDTIYFTKRFLTGNLAGLSVTSHLRFDRLRVAEVTRKLRIGSKGRDCITKDRWIVTDASFQNYAR